ncbi:MAG: S41 family peptidase [Bryobacteraceae bacterium]|nr:S41 family peptidase [Bryobacteraceae bacterium]
MTRRVLIGAAFLAAAAWGQRPEPDGPVDESARQQVVNTLAERLENRYVFPKTAKKIVETLRRKQQDGGYKSLDTGRAFARQLTADLQEISKDKHLRVNYVHEGVPELRRPSPEDIERQRKNMARMNYGFEKVERLEGNIGYLDLRGFMDPALGGDTAFAAMQFLANTDSLIIDLRRNGGGSPGMVALITSWLFGDNRVHLNDLYYRPADSTEQWHTLPWVPGKRYAGKDVYLLTSKYTFSAAEEFTYNLKNLKRATIVGETTGGGAHPGEGVKLHDKFSAFISTGRAINPYSKTNWEGTGVAPDVAADAETALKKAHLMALEKLLEKGGLEPPRLKQAIEDKIVSLKKELGQ